MVTTNPISVSVSDDGIFPMTCLMCITIEIHSSEMVGRMLPVTEKNFKYCVLI